MPRRTQRTSLRADPLQILRGGKAPPKDIVRECIADLAKKNRIQLDRRNATERQMAKLLGEARGAEKIDARDARGAVA